MNMKELINIQPPLLNDVAYGSSLNDVVNNINENFKILANRDFVKGDKGDSMITKTIDLSTNESILNQLKRAVSNQYYDNPIKPKPINGIDVFKWFDNPGHITLVYEIIDGEEVIVSSMPYIFKDLRFNELYKSIDNIDYDEETDYSCAIYYQQGDFVAVQEFPTIYYDANSGQFSWKLNGVKTGLEAMGPQGKPGKDGVFKIVKVLDYAVGPDVYKIDSILYGKNIISVNDGTEQAVKPNGEVILDGNGNPTIISNQIDICKYYGITEGISVMVIKDDNTYISEVWVEENTSNFGQMLVVRCADDNMICEVEAMSKQEVLEMCETYLGK